MVFVTLHYITLHGSDSAPNKLSITLLNSGNNSIYLISAQFNDYQNEYFPKTVEEFLEGKNTFNLPELPKNSAQLMGVFQLPDINKNTLEYMVQYSTRNSHFLQTIKLRKVNNKWCQTTRVRTLMDNKTLLIKSDKDFPFETNEIDFWKISH